MEGMIFAAGLGTRLKPLTDTKPKALVKINGKTLLERTIEKFIEHNVCHIVINVHHFADMMKNYINELSQKYNCQLIISDESDELLDTGGGLVNAERLFSLQDDILIHNVDVLSDIDLTDMHAQFVKNDCLAMLAVKKRKTSRYFLFNEDNLLSGWVNVSTNEKIITRQGCLQTNDKHKQQTDCTKEKQDGKAQSSFDAEGMSLNENQSISDDDNSYQFNGMNMSAFSGVQIVSPKIFEKITQKGAFSITKTYLELSKSYPITSYLHEGNWVDCGKPEALSQAEKMFAV